MHWLRWQMFKFFSYAGWVICPEPERSDLRRRMKMDVTQNG